MVFGLGGLEEPILEAGGIEGERRGAGRACLPHAVFCRQLADGVIPGSPAIGCSLASAGTGVAGIERQFSQVAHPFARLEKAA